MGIAASAEDRAGRKRNDEIDRQQLSEKKKKRNTVKMLLLGTGECGKSTILKQLKILHHNGFTEEDYSRQKIVSVDNALAAMESLILAMGQLGVKYKHAERETDAAMIISAIAQDKHQLDQTLVTALMALWNDAGIQEVYGRSTEFQLIGSAAYFLDRVEVISKPDYSPTVDDILHSRVKTTGVVEVTFVIRNVKFRTFDVGGQRSERKKWIHCFDDVNAIIYVTAISEYDQMLFEDNLTNRLHESLRLFESICNSQWFMKSSMILFLNKKDLFEEKIKHTPITKAFPGYTGKMTAEAAAPFITEQFTRLNLNSNRQIYPHLTCATDTGQVKHILNATTDMIISKNMQGAGLV